MQERDLLDRHLDQALLSDSQAAGIEDKGVCTQADPTCTPENAKVDSKWSVLVVELVHLLGLFLLHSRYTKSARATEVLFNQCLRYMAVLSQMPGDESNMIVRQIPAVDCSERYPQYLILCGPITIAGSNGLSGKLKPTSNILRALEQAFGCLVEQGIHALYLSFADQTKAQVEKLRLALNIIARFHQAAVENNASITFRYFGRALTIPLIPDKNGRPDPNLTLMAGLNGLTALNTRELIKQADALYALSADQKNADHPVSSYDRIFAVRSLRAQLLRPPVEINHFPWINGTLASRAERIEMNTASFGLKDSVLAQPPPTPKTCLFTKAIETGFSLSALSRYLPAADKTAQRLLSKVFSADFTQISSQALALRLHEISSLFQMFEQQSESRAACEALLRFLHERMQHVPDALLHQLSIQRQSVTLLDSHQSIVLGMMHPQLIDLITLIKERVWTRRKFAAVQALGFDFNTSDTQALAERLEINRAEVAHILFILRACFDDANRFRLTEFKKQAQAVAQHADTLFEMLWCYLKQFESVAQRLDFLSAIAMCARFLKDARHAFRFLLSDIYHAPFDVGHSDRNAFILVNALLHHSRHRLDAANECTPENLLQKEREIIQETQEYALWRLDFDQVRVLTKQRTLNDLFMQAIKGQATQSRQQFDPFFLLALERETFLFFAMTGSQTARLVLRDAIEKYGDPHGPVYRNQVTTALLGRILENLRIAVRGIGRIGGQKDVNALKGLERVSGRLKSLHADTAHARQVSDLEQWIAPSIKAIQMRR